MYYADVVAAIKLHCNAVQHSFYRTTEVGVHLYSTMNVLSDHRTIHGQKSVNNKWEIVRQRSQTQCSSSINCHRRQKAKLRALGNSCFGIHSSVRSEATKRKSPKLCVTPEALLAKEHDENSLRKSFYALCCYDTQEITYKQQFISSDYETNFELG